MISRSRKGFTHAIVLAVAAAGIGLAPASARASGQPVPVPDGARASDEPGPRVYFQFGQAQVTPLAAETLKAFAENLKASSYSKLIVHGAADTSGSAAVNARISKKRAQAVAAALEKLGIPRAKMMLSWTGEAAMARETSDEVREPENRVVEIRIRRH